MKSASSLPDNLLADALRAQSQGTFIARCGGGPDGLEIIFANAEFGAMTGYSPAALQGRGHGFLHSVQEDAKKILQWQKTARPGQPFAGEGFLRRKRGNPIHASWNYSLIPGEAGQPAHVVANYQDTTAKRRLQEALVHAQRLDAVGRLAGGVAHDFNNLLSVINGYSQILVHDLADRPNAQKGIEFIHRAGEKAATLTRQLLAFGRREPLRARVLDLNRFVQDNAEILARLLDEKGRLELALDPKIGRVKTGPAQFQQVLLNLVLNAREALRANGRVVIATSRRKIRSGLNRRVTDAPPGNYVCLSVSDNGIGMDAETKRQLFEPFFTTKPVGEGTGLGLSLVYGVVQQSGGFINVKSAPRAGAKFEILLPETREAASGGDNAKGIEPLPSTRGYETILLIEEDDVVRKMVAGILTADGYRVVAAPNAAVATREARAQPKLVQLLISNLTGDNATLAQGLHEANRRLKVLCTAQREAVTVPAWLKPGRCTYLPKPYALSELLKRVRALLDA